MIEYASLAVHNFPEPVVHPGVAFLREVDRNYALVLKHLSDKPTLVYYANNRIVQLTTLIHSHECVDYLNQHGLHIYLYEPICSYIIGDPYNTHTGYNCGFFSEFPNNPVDAVNIRSSELDSIKIYIDNNKLTNVTVHTGDYLVEKYYPHYTDSMTLICDDIFLRGLTMYNNIDFNRKKTFNHKFISVNWRFASHRYLVASFLTQVDSIMSWYYSVDSTILRSSPWINADDYHSEHYAAIMKGIMRLESITPLELDIETKEVTKIDEYAAHFYPYTHQYLDGSNPVSQNYVTLPLEEFYSKVFVDVVTESRYAQPTANISEKTFQAIQFMTPFILVAPPRTLEYMRTLGFKTFSRWWDESYDTCDSHIDRLNMIFNLITTIQSMPKKKIQMMYEEMIPTLKHNVDVLISLTRHGKLIDLVSPKVSKQQWHHLNQETSKVTTTKEKVLLVAGSTCASGAYLDGINISSEFNTTYSIGNQLGLLLDSSVVNIAKPLYSMHDILLSINDWVANKYISGSMDLTLFVVWENVFRDITWDQHPIDRCIENLLIVSQVQQLAKANGIAYIMCSSSDLTDISVDALQPYMDLVDWDNIFNLGRATILPTAEAHAAVTKTIHSRLCDYDPGELPDIRTVSKASKVTSINVLEPPTYFSD